MDGRKPVDFFLFSVFPVLLVGLFRFLGSTKLSERSAWWLGLYVLLNTIYHWFSFAPFADRFASFSWFLLPIVVYLVVLDFRGGVLRASALTMMVLVNVALLQGYTGRWIEL